MLQADVTDGLLRGGWVWLAADVTDGLLGCLWVVANYSPLLRLTPPRRGDRLLENLLDGLDRR